MVFDSRANRFPIQTQVVSVKNNSSVCPLFFPSMLLLFAKEQIMKSLEISGKIAGIVCSCSYNYLDKVGDKFLIELAKKPSVPFLKLGFLLDWQDVMGSIMLFAVLYDLGENVASDFHEFNHRHSRCDRHRVPKVEVQNYFSHLPGDFEGEVIRAD